MKRNKKNNNKVSYSHFVFFVSKNNFTAYIPVKKAVRLFVIQILKFGSYRA